MTETPAPGVERPPAGEELPGIVGAQGSIGHAAVEVPAPASPAATTADLESDRLVVTGSSVELPTVAGLVLVGVGATAVAATRRRRTG